MKVPQMAAAILLALTLLGGVASATEAIEPADAAERVQQGRAILVDVREPEEWRSGVATPAHLLPLSDLRGEREQWAPFLGELEDGDEVILYCRSGNRASVAAEILRSEGIRVHNAGGFRDWKAAGLSVRDPEN